MIKAELSGLNVYIQDVVDGVPFTYLQEQLPPTTKADLVNLRELYLVAQNTPVAKQFWYFTREADMAYMTPMQLKRVCDPKNTALVDFRTIDTTPPFTTYDLNKLHPGAIDRDYFRTTLSNQGMLWGSVMSIVPTQMGDNYIAQRLIINYDVEDMMAGNTISQGIHLQNAYHGHESRPNTLYNSRGNPVRNPVPSIYIGET